MRSWELRWRHPERTLPGIWDIPGLSFEKVPVGVAIFPK
jgi:hypothetical protein